MKRTTPVLLCSRLDYLEHKQATKRTCEASGVNEQTFIISVSEELAYTENGCNITISQTRVWVRQLFQE